MNRRAITCSYPMQRGFTLVEMVMVIVILGIASVALMDQFVNTSKSYLINEQLQTATQLAQECAEHILATRRGQDYAAAIVATCPPLPLSYSTAGYARTRTVSFAPAACVTAPCAQVDVVVTHSASATDQARIVFMLGSY